MNRQTITVIGALYGCAVVIGMTIVAIALDGRRGEAEIFAGMLAVVAIAVLIFGLVAQHHTIVDLRRQLAERDAILSGMATPVHADICQCPRCGATDAFEYQNLGVCRCGHQWIARES